MTLSVSLGCEDVLICQSRPEMPDKISRLRWGCGSGWGEVDRDGSQKQFGF